MQDVVIEVREPYARAALVHFLTIACVPGVETLVGGVYARTLRLAHGPARVEVRPLLSEPGTVRCAYDGHPADLAAATARLAALVDAGHDPEPADAALAGHPLLAALVRATPGLRVHRDADVFEVAVRTVIGQQVSVAGARTLTSRMVTAVGTPADLGEGLTHLFPTPEQVAATAPEDFAMPRSRGRALVGLAAGGGRGRRRPRGTRRPCSAARPAGHRPLVGRPRRDALTGRPRRVPADRHRGASTPPNGWAPTCPRVVAASRAWRPWRSYALIHLWQVATTVGAPRLGSPPCGRSWSLAGGRPAGRGARCRRRGDHRDRVRAVRRPDGRPLGDRDDDHPVLVGGRDQLRAYFDRDLKEFDLPLGPQGTDFQQPVWRQLELIGVRRDRVVRRDRAAGSARPTRRPARSAWPTAATRSRS